MFRYPKCQRCKVAGERKLLAVLVASWLVNLRRCGLLWRAQLMSRCSVFVIVSQATDCAKVRQRLNGTVRHEVQQTISLDRLGTFALAVGRQFIVPDEETMHGVKDAIYYLKSKSKLWRASETTSHSILTPGSQQDLFLSFCLFFLFAFLYLFCTFFVRPWEFQVTSKESWRTLTSALWVTIVMLLVCMIKT